MTETARGSVPLASIKSGDLADRRIERCARCGGRFPAPGVGREGRVYCCDNCAIGPSPKMMARMLPTVIALLGASAAAGWLAGRGYWKIWNKGDS